MQKNSGGKLLKTVYAAFINTMKEDPDLLTALGGPHVYPPNPDLEAQVPRIIIKQLGESQDLISGGQISYRTINILIHAETFTKTIEIADLVKNCILGDSQLAAAQIKSVFISGNTDLGLVETVFVKSLRVSFTRLERIKKEEKP